MPFVVGAGDLSGVTEEINLNSIPLKFPGTEFRIPNELGCVRELLQTCASFEQKVNPHVDGYYAYLSLQRSYVEAGEHQGSGGLHSDEIQGRRVQPKEPIIQVFVATDGDPTEYFPQSFSMQGVNPDIHLMDDVFDSQVDEESHMVRFNPGDIVYFDPYCVHRPPRVINPGYRTVFKFRYTPRQYDRAGNTINALFTDEYEKEGWEFGDRSKPTDFVEIPHILAPNS